ncbi:hypothetical protein [Brevundimonas diminuta]|uniref:hypothetical protein n=1 Tax=Brevundimonas diminuta TaxID=293 RepID=UPI001F597259|nr:hypothetical protein [Brevundimonas diminuta]
MKNDFTALIVFAIIAIIFVGFGTNMLGTEGFVVFAIGLVIGFVFIFKSLSAKSDLMKISGFAIMALSLVAAIGVRQYTGSRVDDSASSSDSYVAGGSDRDRTLEGMDADSRRRYDSLNSDGQAYVDEQMRKYDDACSRSSRC